MQSVRALILGAGRGKRMRPLSDSTPKPLLRFHGKRMIDWQIDALIRAGVRDFVVNTAHLADQFPAQLGDGHERGITIRYSKEGIPKRKHLKPSAASPRRSRFFLLMA